MVSLMELALVAFVSMGAFSLLAVGAFLAIMKNRPGVALFLGGLLVLCVLLPAGLVLLYAMRQGVPGFEFSAPTWRHTNAHFVDGPRHTKLAVGGFGILLTIGAAAAIGATLWRRTVSTGNCAASRGSKRWPLLLCLPLLFFLFAGSFRFETRQHSQAGSHRQAQIAVEHAMREQEHQAILAQQNAELSARLDRDIQTMDIHVLMDKFDAPRIVLHAPSSATIPFLANLPHPLLAPAKAAVVKLLSEASTELAAMEAESDDPAAVPLPVVADDPQLHAEAAAGAKVLAAEIVAAVDSTTNTQAENPIPDPAEADQPTDPIEPPEPPSPSVARVNTKPAEATAEPQAEAEATAELSTPIAVATVKPKDTPERPSWVVKAPKRVGDVRQEVVVTEEWSSDAECEKARDLGLLLKTYAHIQRLYGAPYQEYRLDPNLVHDDGAWDFRLHQLNDAGVTLDFILREIAKEEYVETVERSVGPMLKAYTLLEFTTPVDNQLRQHWDAYLRRDRFAAVSLGASGLLSLLGFTWGLLKVDTLTKGYYTKRLFLGVPAAIIGGLGLLAFIVENFG